MTEPLAEKSCTPCRGGIPPLTRDEAQHFQAQAPDWSLDDEAQHRTEISISKFPGRLSFIQEVGELAEAEGHHPDITFGWGYATVSLTTKKIKGLHENDFIMARRSTGSLVALPSPSSPAVRRQSFRKRGRRCHTSKPTISL